MSGAMRWVVFLTLSILLHTNCYAIQYFNVGRPKLGVSKVYVEIDTFSPLNRMFTVDLREILEKTLLFRNVLTPGKADYVIQFEGSVGSRYLLVKINDKNDKRKKVILLGVKFKKDGKDYLQKRVAALGNHITKKVLGLEGALGTPMIWSELVGSRKALFLGKFGIKGSKKQVTFNQFSNSGASWSPDGKNIIYTSHTAKGTIINLQQVIPLRIRPVTIYTQWGSGSSGHWAIDNSIYLTVHINQRNSDIYRFLLAEVPSTSKVDMKEVGRLTSSPRIETGARVSPDGQKMVYISDKTGNPQIYLMDLKSGKSKKISRGSRYNVEPVWSPDGKYIAYSSIRKGLPTIIRLEIKTGSSVKLTSSIYAESPTWSPDGSIIAFTGKRKVRGVTKIYYSLASGGGVRRFTNSESRVSESSPAWCSQK